MVQQSTFDISRRTFMHAAAAGALTGSPLAQLAQAQPAPAAAAGGKKVGYALVGLGNLTVRQILPALRETKFSKCTALVSGDANKGKKLAEKFGVDPKAVYTYDNYDDLKDNPDVDVVYIALPNSMHAEYTVRGAKAGKHVFCEKPMANTVAECQQMIDACRAAKKKLMIAYRLRYEPINNAAIEMVRDKVMGEPRIITAEAAFYLGGASDPRNLPWRLNKKLAGGGAMLDIGIYALNATRYLTGEEPVEVHAMSYTPPNDPRFAEVEDAITWQMKFPSGVLANCYTTYSAGGNRFRVIGRDGFIECEPFLSYGGLSLRKHVNGKTEPVNLPQVNHFAAEFDHMSECVLNDKEPLTPGEEGLKDLKVIEAIYEAIETQKTAKVS